MRTAIVTAGGIGDQSLALQCASFIKDEDVTIISASRDETFEGLVAAFGHLADIERFGEEIEGEELLKRMENLTSGTFSRFDQVYYVTPDMLYRGKFGFDFRRYNTNPRTILTKRLLTDLSKPAGVIYCGLASVRPDYRYRATGALLNALGEALPEYTIVAPFVRSWQGQDMGEMDFEGLPSNVLCYYDLSVKTALDLLQISSYGIFLDNGFSHLAYHYGVPRILLDPHVGKPAFIARWRQDLSESVPLTANHMLIANIVEQNLRVPQTLLLPRTMVGTASGIDWKDTLIFKA